MSRTMTESSLPARVLLVLSAEPERPSALAKLLDLSPTDRNNIGSSLSRLYRKGYAQRGRAGEYMLTPSGLEEQLRLRSLIFEPAQAPEPVLVCPQPPSGLSALAQAAWKIVQRLEHPSARHVACQMGCSYSRAAALWDELVLEGAV